MLLRFEPHLSEPRRSHSELGFNTTIREVVELRVQSFKQIGKRLKAVEVFNDDASPGAESRKQTRLGDIAVMCPFERITGLPLNEPDLVWRLREHYNDEINIQWKKPGSMRVPDHSLRLQGKDLVDFDHLSNGSWAWEIFRTFVYQDNGS